MEAITKIAASLTLRQYILLYAAAFILALAAASVGNAKSRSAREGVIAVLALFGGMLAVGYVAVRLGKNPGVLLLVILAVFAAFIGFPAARLSARLADRRGKPKKPEENAAAQREQKR